MTTAQATMFDNAENGNGSRCKPEIDPKVIQAELQELTTAKVKVKLNKHLVMAVSIKETDGSYLVQLNPKRIRTQGKLDGHLNFCRATITGLH